MEGGSVGVVGYTGVGTVVVDTETGGGGGGGGEVGGGCGDCGEFYLMSVGDCVGVGVVVLVSVCWCQ